MGTLAKVRGCGIVAELLALVLVLRWHLASPSRAFGNGVLNVLGKTYGEWAQFSRSGPGEPLHHRIRF